MKIIHKENLPDFSLPLPLYNSIHMADAICKRGEEFDIFIGLEKKYTEQLKTLSLDESDVDLQKNTGDRARFGEGSYEDWYKKNRTPFALVHKQTDKLAALVWLGPSPLDGNEEYHTIGWRSYPSFRGTGLMRNFIQQAMETYNTYIPNIKFWISTKKDNAGSIKLATSLGFEVLEKDSDAVSWVMVKNNSMLK